MQRRFRRHVAHEQCALEQEGFMLDQQQDTGHATPEQRSRTSLYRRTMPGGGYVEVEVEATGDAADPAGRRRGRVILERRADMGRRVSHQPPVVAELVGDDMDGLMAELFRLVRDNAALARSLMRWQSARGRAD
jgi:hypothetical protein